MYMIPIQTKPTRTWFLAQGYKQADTRYTNGYAVWLHPHTNDVLSPYGTKLILGIVPNEKFLKSAVQYLRLDLKRCHILLARLKYLTFVGPIKEGDVVDHIDGNTMNNDIDNLRAVPKAINFRDAGFMRKLRNKGIDPTMYAKSVLLRYYKRMAKWKATHTQYQYDHLTREELLHLLVGPKYKLVDPTILAAQEPDKYL